MGALYRLRFAEGRSTTEALHEASLAALRGRRARGQSAHPFYWAAFVGTGDWR
jgi:CHAT domain-containing protein